MQCFIEWQKNNVTQFTQQASCPDNTAFSILIDSANTTLGDNWTAQVLLDDGTANSSWVNSTPLEILNTFPLFEFISNFALDEDFSNFEMNISLNASDPDDIDENLNYTINISNFNLITFDLDNFTGNLTFYSVANVFGTTDVNLTVYDTLGEQNSTNFTLTITSVNDLPLFEFVDNITRDEDFSQFTIDLSSNISDVETSDTNLLIQFTNTSATGTVDLVVNNATNVATFKSISNIFGDVIINFTTFDESGEQNSTEFTLIINAINDAPSVPVINLPLNGTTFNTLNIDFNVSNSTDIEDDNIIYGFEISTDNFTSTPTLVNYTIAETANTTNVNFTLSTEDVYNFRWFASDGTANSSYSKIVDFSIDVTNPIITWTTPTENNLTVADASLNFNIGCSDDNLFGLNVTTYNDTAILQTNTTIDINSTSFTRDDVFDTSGLNEENVTVETSCSDDSTSKEIPSYNPSKDVATLKIDYENEGNTIGVKLKDNSTPLDDFSTWKETDRYIFNFDFSTTKPKDSVVNEYIFKLSSGLDIFYRPDSIHNAHFVTGENWINFDLDTEEEVGYEVKLAGAGYEIEITTKETNLTFTSIGGLNIVIEYVTFNIDHTAPLIEIAQPTNTTFTTNESLALNFSIIDPNEEDSWFNVQNLTEIIITNTTLSGNTTFNVTFDTSYTLRLYANDSTGLENVSSVEFTIDTQSPAFRLTNPTNTTYFNVELNLEFVKGGTEDSIWYHEDNKANITLNSSLTFTSSEGSHILFLYANDSVGNVNVTSVSYTVVIDIAGIGTGGSQSGGGGITCPKNTELIDGECQAIIELPLAAVFTPEGASQFVENVGEAVKDISVQTVKFFTEKKIFGLALAILLFVVSVPRKGRKKYRKLPFTGSVIVSVVTFWNEIHNFLNLDERFSSLTNIVETSNPALLGAIILSVAVFSAITLWRKRNPKRKF